MSGFVQHITLLCCFTLLFLLQGNHLSAQPAITLQAPESLVRQNPPSSVSTHEAMQDIFDIYGPVELPDPPPYHWYALLAALGSALSVLFYFIYRTLNKKETATIDPADVARSELHRAEALLPSSGIVPYCQKVSDTLRTYVEQRTGCKITRRTTSESLRDLANQKHLSSAEIDTLERCFRICDKVKFARFSLHSRETETLAEQALWLVSGKHMDSDRGESS